MFESVFYVYTECLSLTVISAHVNTLYNSIYLNNITIKEEYEEIF